MIRPCAVLCESPGRGNARGSVLLAAKHSIGPQHLSHLMKIYRHILLDRSGHRISPTLQRLCQRGCREVGASGVRRLRQEKEKSGLARPPLPPLRTETNSRGGPLNRSQRLASGVLCSLGEFRVVCRSVERVLDQSSSVKKPGPTSTLPKALANILDHRSVFSAIMHTCFRRRIRRPSLIRGVGCGREDLARRLPLP